MQIDIVVITSNLIYRKVHLIFYHVGARNSSIDDVKALFGPYYLEHSGGVLNDDNRFICYGYDMEDGSSYEMTFGYSDETKKITQFSISVKEK